MYLVQYFEILCLILNLIWLTCFWIYTTKDIIYPKFIQSSLNPLVSKYKYKSYLLNQIHILLLNYYMSSQLVMCCWSCNTNMLVSTYCWWVRWDGLVVFVGRTRREGGVKRLVTGTSIAEEVCVDPAGWLELACDDSAALLELAR